MFGYVLVGMVIMVIALSVWAMMDDYQRTQMAKKNREELWETIVRQKNKH